MNDTCSVLWQDHKKISLVSADPFGILLVKEHYNGPKITLNSVTKYWIVIGPP